MKHVSDSASFRREVLEAHGPVLALFYAAWCPFCRAYLPVYRQAEAPGVRRVEVDLSDEGNPLWEAYDVRVVPTLILYEGGEVVDRVDGRPLRGLREEDIDRVLGLART